MPVLASKPPLPAASAERKQEMQGGAESPRPVVIRRIPALRDSLLYEPAFDVVAGLECGDHARVLRGVLALQALIVADVEQTVARSKRRHRRAIVGDKLIASLRDMDHMAPRPGDDAWRDPLPADLGPLSDDGEGAR